MITFYFNAAPNPAKVALMLEETGLAYEAIPIDTRKGQQFEAGFLKVRGGSGKLNRLDKWNFCLKAA